MKMKPAITITTAILVSVLAAGLASAQSPSIIQNTRNTMTGVNNNAKAASNGALGIQQSTPAAKPVELPRHAVEFRHADVDLADAGEAFNENGIDRFLLFEKVQVRDRDLFNHGAVPACGICRTCLQERNVQDVPLPSAARIQDR